MFCGFLRKVWKIPHSPCPGVAPTESASTAIAPFGGEPKAFVTESLNPYWSAPLVPPAMLPVSPTIFAIVFRAVATEGSVHLILCWDSWLYFAAPNVRR